MCVLDIGATTDQVCMQQRLHRAAHIHQESGDNQVRQNAKRLHQPLVSFFQPFLAAIF